MISQLVAVDTIMLSQNGLLCVETRICNRKKYLEYDIAVVTEGLVLPM